MPVTSPTKFIDSPSQKTVSAIFPDGSIVIIQAMSDNNYTNPPGYLDPSPDINAVRLALQRRIAEYRSNLNTQLNG